MLFNVDSCRICDKLVYAIIAPISVNNYVDVSNIIGAFYFLDELNVYKEQHLLDRNQPVCFMHYMVCFANAHLRN
jgi:hypothetical protein